MSFNPFHQNPDYTLTQKLGGVTWGLVLIVCTLAGIGCTMLYSAASGAWEPWAKDQALRFGVGFFGMMAVALIDVRVWFRWAWVIYALAVGLLVATEVGGVTGQGAQRWIDLKVIQLQPSELMKVALVLALARYFHGLSEEEVARPTRLIAPLLAVAVPVGLVMQQPDLGTGLILLMIAGAVFFAAGVRLWKFGVVIGAGIVSIPIAWQFLHAYQKERVLTFLNPQNDPLGDGYHILQSKIALGAGGLFGKGFLEGTQSHLNFLPEKQTDFIFTMLAEEFGMAGGLALLGLYAVVLLYGLAIGMRAHNHFGRLLALGLTVNIFLYVFLNIAMVMGVIPVVGVPLPLISYGGTAMLAMLGTLGLLMSVHVHRDVRIPRRGLEDEQ
ncbi:cell elongation-specific peptidoglycan biosynthesis regulator RodA [Limimonas halophila]|uniref:Peptidoglycan glycosyltransferase MrdB n=1 Tax=Limimonas halophila TaxID=1082479 RepID=A0A1G7L1T2_9PROT|nr:rod shape-determining protein RodA [Limimonas halophila]SDF43306.1 cell elongation-specific peptidoglycan biosynthesis regulator RodA [Limimonas halophila]